jgi:predicted Rossmann-fold nucleotide-binding protein
MKTKLRVLNLTQHTASREQVAAGVYEPRDRAAVQRLLTFDTLPTTAEVEARAQALAELVSAEQASVVMIGGAPFLMGPLERAMAAEDSLVTVLYAFSVRESAEQVQPDGSVRKVQTFRHTGWVEAEA